MGVQVRELRDKLDDIKRYLGFTKNFELAAHFHVDATRITQWHGKDGIPEHQLRGLAGLLGLPLDNLRDWSAAQLRDWLDVGQPGAVLYKHALERARDGMIHIVRLDPPAETGGRGMQPRSRSGAEAPPIEEVPASAQTLLEITMPWQQLLRPPRAAVLLLLTDDAGTVLLTPTPVVVGNERQRLRLPEAVEADPFVFTAPLGRHCAVALVTSHAAVDLQNTIGEVLGAAGRPLSNRQLNLLGRTVQSAPAYEWVVGRKEFFVTRD